ncbi:hypothetical protein FSP39_011736 [Pinctada imbricata]|uniref:NACHT domain-containing protein n=1 Tax=Pinctada imbricata TaxID=66713 RepID=A0AA88YDR4_PINIB|nr:hypothetical protein FSP39_011736 [Pinctada imbricata]
MSATWCIERLWNKGGDLQQHQVATPTAKPQNTQCKNTEQTSTERDAKGERNVNAQHRNIKHKGLHINRRDQWATGADLGRSSVTKIAEDVVISITFRARRIIQTRSVLEMSCKAIDYSHSPEWQYRLPLCFLRNGTGIHYDGINMAHIETIRDVRNKLAHAKNAYLDNQSFRDYWTKVKIALTNLAVYVSKEAKEEADEKVDELENRVMNTKVLEEMRNLICDEKRYGEMEQLSNLTAEVSKVIEKVTEVKETTEKTTNKVALMESQLNYGLGGMDINVKELRTLIIDINDSEASGIQTLPLKTDHTVDPDSIYVPVSITDETETRNSNSSSSDDVRNVTSEKMFFVQQDKPARFVFMLGDAGFGKTLHCQRMTKLWCQVWKDENETSKNQYLDLNLAGCLKQFDFLFFVQLHDVHCESISLIEIIQDVYSRYRLSKERLDNIRWILEGEAYSSLVLLDGLDEWNISEEKRKVLLDKCIPNCRDMPKSTILISMRSWKFMEVEKICRPKVDRVIRLHGISEDNIPQLSRKMLVQLFQER